MKGSGKRSLGKLIVAGVRLHPCLSLSWTARAALDANELTEADTAAKQTETLARQLLQEREFERLGGTRTEEVNVRVVAATHRNLEEMIVEKQFRRDLYYRLNVFPISIPPLRERPEDIPLLVRHFVQQFARRMNKTIEAISSETLQALTRYTWPGNIRELQNVVERSVVIYDKGNLSVKRSWLSRESFHTGPAT